MANKGAPRKHHYVPRFLIKRFADQRSKVHAYDRRTGRHLHDQNPRRVLVTRDLYRNTLVSESEQFVLEQLFSKMESHWAVTIERVVKRGRVLPEEVSPLSEFLSLQYARTYRMRDDIRNMTRYYRTGITILDLKRRLKNGDIQDKEKKIAEEIIEKLSEGEFRAEDADEYHLALQLRMVSDIVNSLIADWHYRVVSLSAPLFVLTDCPITLIGDWPGDPLLNIGLENAAEIWTPLDPKHALVLTRDTQMQSNGLSLPRSHAHNVNKRLALESFQWTIYRPRTYPLKTMMIPRRAPELVVEDLLMRDPVSGDLRQVTFLGRERVNIDGECLLSGRPIRPFPQRPRTTMRDKTWLPNENVGGAEVGI